MGVAGADVVSETQPLLAALPDAEKGEGAQEGGSTAPSSLQLFVQAHKIPLIVCYYGLCSSTLIVINKVAVYNLQAPVFILVLQLLFSAAAVKGCAAAGVLDAEPLRWRLVRPFLLIVGGFLGTLYANIKVLVYSNVETFITFRSSTPLVLSVFDYVFLGRELPGGRSVASLVLLLASCAGYTYYDHGFRLQAYGWLCVWYVFFLFEACYVKYTCDTVAMTNWGRVYYTNFLSALALLAVFPACAGEHALLRQHSFSAGQVALLGLSCAVGVCMSHAGYLMRSNVSATAGVVVGVVCKIGSVLLNLLIWDQHASPIQLCFLAMGLAGGSLFKQAPLRATVKAQASSGGAAGAGHAHAGSGGGSGGGHKALTPPAEAPPEAVAAIAKAAAGGGRLLSGKGGAAHRPRLSTASARGTDEA